MPRGDTRFFVFIVGALIVVLGIVLAGQVIGSTLLDDLEPTDEFEPSDDYDQAGCWFTPSTATFSFYEPDAIDEPLDEPTVIESSGPYEARGRSTDYVYIVLDDGTEGWVSVDEGTISGLCSGMPFEPGGGETGPDAGGGNIPEEGDIGGSNLGAEGDELE